MGTQKVTHGEYLQSAFADFERASAELKSFYASLETRVAELTETLHTAERLKSLQLAAQSVSANQLAAVFDALPAGVVELASNGTVCRVNPAAKEFLGPVNDGEQWSKVVERVFKPRVDDGHDISLGDGRRVNIETAALPGRAGQILLIKDVTDTRRLLDRLNHHQRLSAKTEVAAALAHQIRTPLSATILHLGRLRHTDEINKISREAVDKSVKSLRHIERLISDMLMYSRDQKFELVSIGITDFAESISKRVRDSAIPIQLGGVSGQMAATRVRANRDALLSVVQNLIDNAIAAGANAIGIFYELEPGAVRIRVKDDGPGVQPELREQIFEPFVTHKPNGSGLGLAIGRAVSRAHGGDLILEDQASDGACFTVLIPVCENSASAIGKLERAFSMENEI
ncbi:MAG: PAS domain-containing sensor histidine kinase [Pseudomonadota bacterium]